MKAVLHLAGGSSRFEIKQERSASAAFFPEEVIHAIVFTPTALADVTPADADAIQSATKPGTCRVYLSADQGVASALGKSQLAGFIQLTSAHGTAAIAKEIFTFFQEADDLNRRFTPLAFRDIAYLRVYRILKALWPISYLSAGLHVLNAASALAGQQPWLGAHASQYIIPASTFFGTFFIVHCIFVVVRNWLFGARIVGKLNLGFTLGAVGFGLAAAATAYSIATTDQSVSRISVSAISAVVAYLVYMYARRIRAECTSLSQLQAAMADTRGRIDMLNTIGRQRLTSSAFPFLPFRSRSLFISYMRRSDWSSENAALAHKWASEHGFEVFLDQRSIPSGALWRQSLLRAVSECVYFVAIIDGDADPTEWVLAESAYAALLRKSIGKPRILLVVRNVERIVKDQQNPFQVIYRDVFQLPPAHCYGAAIFSIGDDRLTEKSYMRALEGVRPMGLLS